MKNTLFITFNKEWSLARAIASHFKSPLHVPEITTFADGECKVTLPDYQKFTDKEVVIIHSTCPPVHENLIYLMLLLHALKNAGAAKITGIIPYFGYARHDHSEIPGTRGSVQMIINLLQAAGLDEVITVEIHEPEVLNYFAIPVHNVTVEPIIAEHIKHHIATYAQYCVVAPDEGARTYATTIAHELTLGTIVFRKERYATDKTRVLNQESHCSQHNGIIVDDIISTGGTALNVCNSLKKDTFARVYGYFVHPVLAGNAVQALEQSQFDTIYVSNTIDLPDNKKSDKFGTFDVSSGIIKVLEDRMDRSFTAPRFRPAVQKQF